MYYEKLKAEIPPNILSLCETIKATKQQLHNARQRRDELKKDVVELEASIGKRRQKTGSVTDSKEKTNNYLGRLRNDTMERDLKNDFIKDLETSFIPKINSDKATLETNLKILTDAFYMDRLRLINNEIDLKAIEIFKMSDAFMGGFQQIYADLGLTLVFNKEELVPIRWWSAREQEEQKVRLGLAGSKEPSYAGVFAHYHKTVKDSEPAEPEKTPAVVDAPPVEAVPEPVVPLSDEQVWGETQPEEIPVADEVEDEPFYGQRQPSTDA